MIKLIATDLDGTLLGDDKVVPEEIFGLAQALKKLGILFVPASGRSPYTLRENFRPIADEIDYICDNGAVAIAGGKTVLSNPVPRDVVLDVLEFCKSEDVHVLLCGTKTTYLAPVEGTKYEPHVHPYYFRRMAFDELGEVPDDVNKIAICDMRNPKAGSFERLVKMLSGRAVATVSGEIWMDVMQNGVNKGNALEAIQKYYGITGEETVAFGDFYNDIPLLKRAAYAYVMKNANEDMFPHGNLVADSNNDGGVLKVLREIAACGAEWKPNI
ncbi:MAG: HAD family hydrolase [Clostridia bacterium]|jgi:Cof subfamily protein (haloacid dehalogenase superfamily)|nr:HAD family hydrolase [Clostridia bacterium]